MPDIAYVHWYSYVPADQDPVDAALGCPVFGRRLVQDDPAGNMCLVQQITPAKLAAVPYRSFGARQQVVILSRFGDFMSLIP